MKDLSTDEESEGATFPFPRLGDDFPEFWKITDKSKISIEISKFVEKRVRNHLTNL